MLAYEFFLKNKESEGRISGKGKPLKKIYISGNKIELDTNGIENYGSDKPLKSALIQDLLSMPLDTSNAEKLNLPDMRTGARSANPYIELYGKFIISKKSKNIKISIGKSPVLDAVLDIDSNDEQYSLDEDVRLSLDKENYMIGDKLLYDQYVDSKIIHSDGTLNKSIFRKTCEKIFEQIKQNKKLIGETKNAKTFFSVMIIPSRDPIKYINSANSGTQNNFKDSFGNDASNYANTPTQTAKFLSYDDPAFTINCFEGEDFYKNLEIGDQSISKINLPNKNIFNISGLLWLFTDIKNKTTFLETKQGIYTQLYKNYLELKKDTDKENSQIKIVCFKKNQAKIEVLLDENMTMQRMHAIFEQTDKNPPHMAFEILIQSTKNTTLWKYYLDAVRVLITGVGLDRKSLISYLNMRLRTDIHKWIRGNTKDACDFFLRSWFSLYSLSMSNEDKNMMNENEEYAYKVGLIAGQYVNFKEKSKDTSNSLRDILAYSKYDREKLRFVFQRIGQGVNLAKAKQESIQSISEYIQQNKPSSEISDNNAYDDYSYFFYKGAFENLGGNFR